MAKKPEPPKEESKSGMIDIDILGMELEKGLPHWLDPIEKYKGKHDADRKKKQIERSNKIMGK